MYIINAKDYANKLIGYLPHSSPNNQEVLNAVINTVNAVLVPATHAGTGASIPLVSQTYEAKANANIEETQDTFAAQQTGQTAIAFIGEHHRSADDKQRAEKFMIRVDKKELQPTLIVLERGLKYNAPTYPADQVIREEDLTKGFGQVLNSEQRSIVVAGYLVACIGSADQHDINKQLLFYGENHAPILTTYFDQLAEASAAAYLLKGKRTFLIFKSYEN